MGGALKLDATMILSMMFGAGVLCAGLWILWGRRILGEGGGEAEDRADAGDAGPGGPSIRDRFSEPTRLVIGLSLLLAGYHIAAWAAPDAWFGVKVPRERWWMLAAGLAIAIAGSLGIDRMEKKSGEG